MATNYAAHPLNYLDEWINSLDDDAAIAFMDESLFHVRTLYSDPDLPINGLIANELDKLTGISHIAWKQYQKTYDTDRARLTSEPNRIVVVPR